MSHRDNTNLRIYANLRIMIASYYGKVKEWIAADKTDLFIAAIIFLVGLASFGLGRLSVLWPKKEPIRIENYELGIMNYGTTTTADNSNPNSKFIAPNSRAKYVASKSGTRYHFPWCPGAQRIKEANKIWFEVKEDAEKAGFKAALNCPGL